MSPSRPHLIGTVRQSRIDCSSSRSKRLLDPRRPVIGLSWTGSQCLERKHVNRKPQLAKTRALKAVGFELSESHALDELRSDADCPFAFVPVSPKASPIPSFEALRGPMPVMAPPALLARGALSTLAEQRRIIEAEPPPEPRSFARTLRSRLEQTASSEQSSARLCSLGLLLTSAGNSKDTRIRPKVTRPQRELTENEQL